MRYYAAPVSEFLLDDPQKIIGILISAAESQGFTLHLHTQTYAWHAEIKLLREVLNDIGQEDQLGLVLEYPIPRRGKRIDAVLIRLNTRRSHLMRFNEGINKATTQ